MDMNASKIANFSADSSVEKKIDKFLCDNYYSRISADLSTFGYSTDSDSQFSGVDLSVNNMLIDEKSKNTSCPSTIEDYYASVELWQKWRNGEWHTGWLIDKSTKTTHYDFLYRYEDKNGDISAVAILRFSRKDMLRWLDSISGLKTIVDAAKKFEDAPPKTGKWFVQDGRKTKVVKSCEGAAVATFRLTDLIDNAQTAFKSFTGILVTKDGYRDIDLAKLRKHLKRKETI